MNKRWHLHYFFLIVFSFFSSFQIALAQCVCTNCRCTDSLALVDLYNSTTGTGWTNNTGWKLPDRLTMSMSSWYGVTLTNGRVTCIDLDGQIGCDVNRASGNNLIGTLPSSLDNLKNMRNLFLSKNKLSGSIPNLNLSNLQELSLHSNQLSGTISNLDLPNLQELYLFSNQLSGTIPNFNFPNLQDIYLYSNQFGGNVPNFNLPKLQTLWLHSNQLIGSIPDFNLPDLMDVNLSRNQLSGKIPNFTLPNLRYLHLSYNQLSSSIPNFNLPNLVSLSLSYNQLTNNIPNFNLPNLTSLSLGRNQLSDSIPNFNFPKLKDINLTKNQLTGNIPNFKFPDLQSLSLDSNSLSGNIPNFNFPKLWSLDLKSNQLSGNIPNFNLPTLGNLFLSNNQLSGNIPNFNLPNLWYLSLSNNQLSGNIPNFNLPRLVYLFLSNNQLSGNIPNFNLPTLANLSLSNNQLSGNIPNFNLPILVYLFLSNNQLSGNIPNFNLLALASLRIDSNQLSGTIPNLILPKLEVLSFYHNKIDSTPRFTNLPSLKKDTTFERGIRNYQNKLTFDDILPNIGFTTTATFIYNPQDSIFKDTTINLRVGTPLSIDLKIDGTLTSNRYVWFKDKVRFRELGDTLFVNMLSIPSVQPRHSGVYTVQVTNPNAPLLTLESHKITVVVDTTTCRYKDSIQLVALYNATGGPNWKNKTNWLSNRPLDEWFGINTNTEGCVTEIDLDGIEDFKGDDGTATGNNLVGSLPTLSFSELTFLDLDTHKGLSGNLPAMTTPKIKVINLGQSNFSGTIPASWNFPQLEYLALCCNQLDGVLPTLNFPKLIGFYIYNNKLKGALPIINAPLLTDIRMNINQLTGCFPASYKQFCAIPNANQRNFSQNTGLSNGGDFSAFCNNNSGICQNVNTCRYQDSIVLVAFYRATTGQNWTVRNVNGKKSPWILTEPMDNWYGVTLSAQGCVQCIDLDGDATVCAQWSDNPPGMNLVGVLPDSMRLMGTLEKLSLRGNRGLTGQFPTNFGDIKSLKYLYIDQCSFRGDFPQSFWRLTNLLELHLESNNFGIPFPAQVLNFRALRSLSFHNTGIFGKLPTAFGDSLTNLYNLILSNNQLSGTVPKSFQNLRKLQVLKLDINAFDSLINLVNLPMQVGDISWGNEANFAHNRLTFDDLLPIAAWRQQAGLSFFYAPQDTIFKDTTITVNIGGTVDMSLGIDGAVRDNLYTWSKDGQITTTNGASNQNRLILRGIRLDQAGIYTCRVKNSALPNLELVSRRIILRVINNCLTVINNAVTKTICTGQTYTLPKGRIVSTSGTYKDTLKSSIGCDSVITTNLTVSSFIQTTVTKVICAGQTYTLPKGRIVSVSGTYQDTLKTSIGCDSIVITTLGMIATRMAQQKHIYCPGDSFRMPKGKIIKGIGTHRDTFRFTNQCDSIVSITFEYDPDCDKKDKIKVTNGLTPDDAENRYFTVDSIENFPDCQLLIHNRWNELVFRSTKPYDNLWNGTDQNNSPLPAGTYYYVLDFEANRNKNEKKRKPQQGFILIMR